MAHARSLPNRTATEANAGTHLDSDLDVLFAWDNAHDANGQTGGGGTAHGQSVLVGTTATQTLSNKTLSSPVINTALNLGLQYEAFAASATATASTVICGVTDTSAALTVTLPSAEIAKTGRVWIIQDESGACGNAFSITVATAGAETINGLNTVTIDENYGRIMLYSNGSNLFIMNE